MKEDNTFIKKSFGYWTVIEQAPSLRSPDGTTRKAYKCKCICGNIDVVAKTLLIRGKSKSCGCKGTFLNKGTRVQEWTVIEKDSAIHSRNKQFYICQCSCGIIRSVSMVDLMHNRSNNCGHSRAILSKGAKAIKEFLLCYNYSFYQEYVFKDLPGRRYDFALYNKDDQSKIIRLIEFDGEQHSPNSKSNWHTEDLINRDIEKNNYALQARIPLVRIPYYKTAITEEDLFGDKYLIKEE